MSCILYHKCYIKTVQTPWVVLVHGAGGSSCVWFKQLKDYTKHFNVLCLDLRGHGKSANFVTRIKKKYNFLDVSLDILNLLDHLKIKSAHFIGLSLGTIIIRNIAQISPKRVKSMVMAGAIIRFNIRSQFLVKIGDMIKGFIPYMWLYRLFAYIIMPQKNHKKSRIIFINQAKKLCQKEFKRWFCLARDVNPLMRFFKEKELIIPTLYLMGQEDYMFLPQVQELVSKQQNSKLNVIKNSGHVCNIESPNEFNKKSIEFLKAN